MARARASAGIAASAAPRGSRGASVVFIFISDPRSGRGATGATLALAHAGGVRGRACRPRAASVLPARSARRDQAHSPALVVWKACCTASSASRQPAARRRSILCPYAWIISVELDRYVQASIGCSKTVRCCAVAQTGCHAPELGHQAMYMCRERRPCRSTARRRSERCGDKTASRAAMARARGREDESAPRVCARRLSAGGRP
jgi:hypothetical protein